MSFRIFAGIPGLAGVAAGLCFLLAGCLVSKDEYNKAKLERDEALASLHEVRTQNEVNATLIGKAYAERDMLLAKLADADKAFSAARDEAASRRTGPTAETDRQGRGRGR